MSYKFKIEKFFPKELFEEITKVRVDNCRGAAGRGSPFVSQDGAWDRKRRNNLTKDGKLTILAADHPARMVTNVGNDEMRMADRYEYLGRILRIITLSEWDGVMGTPDIIEELMILDRLVKERGGKSFFDDKVMIGCMNRGGLKGAIFELDDRFTSFTAQKLHEMRLDGAKLMFRLNLQSVDSLDTMEYCAKAINQLNNYGINVFLECLYVDDKLKAVKKAQELAKVVSVAAALGSSSRRIWLKIPYCDNFDRVASATTCPILMLGGEARGDSTPLLEDFISGMKAGSNVRGVLVGRNLLYPGDDDPQAIAGAVSGIVHKGYGLKKAKEYIGKNRGKDMDILRNQSQGNDDDSKN